MPYMIDRMPKQEGVFKVLSYELTEYLDGRVYVFTKGTPGDVNEKTVDYDIDDRVFATILATTATMLGYTPIIHQTEDGVAFMALSEEDDDGNE